jgi:hypothetical protein
MKTFAAGGNCWQAQPSGSKVISDIWLICVSSFLRNVPNRIWKSSCREVWRCIPSYKGQSTWREEPCIRNSFQCKDATNVQVLGSCYGVLRRRWTGIGDCVGDAVHLDLVLARLSWWGFLIARLFSRALNHWMGWSGLLFVAYFCTFCTLLTRAIIRCVRFLQLLQGKILGI